jgi:hypothetical protein
MEYTPTNYSADQDPTYGLMELGPLTSISSLNGMGFGTDHPGNQVPNMTISVL